MKIVFTLLMILNLTGITFGQADSSRINPSGKGIGFNLGMRYTRLIDEGFIGRSVLFHGSSFTFKLDYSTSGQKYILLSVIEGSIGAVKAGRTLRSSIFDIDLKVIYQRHVGRYLLSGHRAQVFAGVELSSLNFGILNVEQLNNGSLLSVHGAYVNVLQIVHLDHHDQFQIGIVLPVAAFVKRSNYDGGANLELNNHDVKISKVLFHNSRLAFVPSFNLSFIYKKHLRPKTDLVLRYDFEVVKNTVDEPLNFYHNEVLAGFKFYFRK